MFYFADIRDTVNYKEVMKQYPYTSKNSTSINSWHHRNS